MAIFYCRSIYSSHATQSTYPRETSRLFFALGSLFLSLKLSPLLPFPNKTSVTTGLAQFDVLALRLQGFVNGAFSDGGGFGRERKRREDSRLLIRKIRFLHISQTNNAQENKFSDKGNGQITSRTIFSAPFLARVFLGKTINLAL
jgi:hypothetical protein